MQMSDKIFNRKMSDIVSNLEENSTFLASCHTQNVLDDTKYFTSGDENRTESLLRRQSSLPCRRLQTYADIELQGNDSIAQRKPARDVMTAGAVKRKKSDVKFHVGVHKTFSQPLQCRIEEEEEEDCLIARRSTPKKLDFSSRELPKKTVLHKKDKHQCDSQNEISRSCSSNRQENTKSDSIPGLIDSKETNYSLFRTRSTNTNNGLSRQISILRKESVILASKDGTSHQNSAVEISKDMPAGRYFDALQGPELEILKSSEDALLPLDRKWPFLLRFPISCFGICLGLGSQSILWKLLSTTPSMHFLHVPKEINIIVWCLALMTLIVIFLAYSLKCLFYFEAVRREYYHPVRVNFFFAPWIASMFLTIGVSPVIATSINPALFWVFMVPITMLELKIYGQWLSGGERKLSKMANPSLHLSVVGNFVGAILGTLAGQREAAIFYWAVGLAHYLVLFVTLYQRLPTNEALPRELHPVFFLFIAAPSTASVAWEGIAGHFDMVSRITYFVALFLFTSLIVRVNLFRGIRFSVTWWAYTFPTTAVSIATVKYSDGVTNVFTKGLATLLSLISTISVSTLFVTTILHAFYWESLFPNDIAIAITQRRRRIKAIRRFSASLRPTWNYYTSKKPNGDADSLARESCDDRAEPKQR
eukprot:c22359_g1_i1 orf=688-2631(+)